MKNNILIGFIFFISPFLWGQSITCSPANKQAVENKIASIKQFNGSPIGESMTRIGKTFLGTPYVAKTLEVGTTETLVVNIQGLDCTTFVENVLAFSMLLEQKEYSFDAFVKNLEIIRYKDGLLNGYASRLHYFSEWIANNTEKGLLKDISAEIGGVEITKEINFMSTHRKLYPFLSDDNNFEKIKASEAYLNDTSICYLPQDMIEANEHLMQSGDIIALTTSINGLDVTHTGIATKEKDGRIHLLHASTVGEVVVSQIPLVDYLKKVKNNTGIIVARPL